MVKKDKNKASLVNALLLSNTVSIGLFLWRAEATGSYWYVFLVWNLFLAWIPLFLAYWLTRRTREEYWLSWRNIALTFAWLGFLPNSFYLVSDFIHIGVVSESVEGKTLNVAMIFLFTFNAYIAGFASLYLVHGELIKRTAAKYAHRLIAFVLFLSGFAIYLGRTLRWNSWDMLVDPIGLFFSVSDRLIDPWNHLDMISMTLAYFAVLGTMYWVIWAFLRYANFTPERK